MRYYPRPPRGLVTRKLTYFRSLPHLTALKKPYGIRLVLMPLLRLPLLSQLPTKFDSASKRWCQLFYVCENNISQIIGTPPPPSPSAWIRYHGLLLLLLVLLVLLLLLLLLLCSLLLSTRSKSASKRCQL